VKGVKRAMAGEYSRELSTKVFMGQCHLIELGFRQGGAAGFGLRRALIDQSGATKGELGRGEQKSIQSDRVVLVPGPIVEVETVRRIYRAFVLERRSETEIAENLNAEKIATDLGRRWTRGTVHQVLINEKYVGNNVWNRVSFKLKKKRILNPPDLLIRADAVFEAIVGRDLFDAAQGIVAARSFRLTNTEMLDSLRALFESEGGLSGIVIDEADGMPSSSAYRSRFGCLLRAYSLIGYAPDRDYCYIEINRALRLLHPRITDEVLSGLRNVGCVVQQDADDDLISVNGEFSISIVIARCCETSAGAYRWRLRLGTGLFPDITIAVRMDACNRAPLDFYLLPSIDMARSKLKLAENNGLALDAYRFDTLDLLYGLAAPVTIAEAA
jgi:hypothetical protein